MSASAYFISSSDFNKFVDNLIQQYPVIAPMAMTNLGVQHHYAFNQLENATQLCLDYDITQLPPKKVFFPPKQVLLEFSDGHFKSVVNAKKQILLGVHPYDLKAIEQTDLLFRENYNDINYTAHREATILIGSRIQTIAKRSFWSSMVDLKKLKGHDAFLSYLGSENLNDTLAKSSGYLFEVLTDKGQELLNYGVFNLASHKQCEQAQLVNEIVNRQCPQSLSYSSDEISQSLKTSFNNTALWDELAKDCFSCGSCNTTCPTCSCFNVEDNWNVDQVSGQRTRYWDSCMTEDFAKISSGAGHSENFRPTTGSRMRHRMMRKMVYLNKKLGSQACVGCGRCATSCTADIADPVAIIETIMQATQDHHER